jgi:hypothetical protein
MPASSKAREKRSLDSFIDKLSDPNGCWLWTGAINQKGYGITKDNHRKTIVAHRLVYITLVGPIPIGLQLDHVKERCKNKHCVNPEHLEPVTGAENMRRRYENYSYKTVRGRNQAKETK